MRAKKFFAAVVTAGLAVFGLAAAAPAATTHTATSGRHGPRVQTINLHKAYSRDLTHVKLHKKVVLPARRRPSAPHDRQRAPAPSPTTATSSTTAARSSIR